MNNLSLIRIPSVRFSAEMVQGRTIYRGIDEFTDRVGQQVRDHLVSAGIGCGPVRRNFKPAGSGFVATSTSGDYFVSISVESKALPEAEITICEDPRRGAVRSWSWFEPFFRRSVESEFAGCIKWTTIDEYVEGEPPSV
jgi:hypothetical protein